MKLNRTLAKVIFATPLVIAAPAFGSTDQSSDPIHDITINRYIKHPASKDLGAIIPGAAIPMILNKFRLMFAITQ